MVYGSAARTHTHTAQATWVSSLSSSLAYGATTTKSHQKFKFYFGKISEQDSAALHIYLRR